MDRRFAAMTLVVLGTAGGSLAAAGAMALARPASAPVPLFAQLAPGRWQVHEIGARRPPREVCVTEPVQLVQIQHGQQACTRSPISSGAKSATVHYSCGGHGGGQTVVTVESPTLVRIQTQGFADGAPFDLDLEARHAGHC